MTDQRQGRGLWPGQPAWGPCRAPPGHPSGLRLRREHRTRTLPRDHAGRGRDFRRNGRRKPIVEKDGIGLGRNFRFESPNLLGTVPTLGGTSGKRSKSRGEEWQLAVQNRTESERLGSGQRVRARLWPACSASLAIKSLPAQSWTA